MTVVLWVIAGLVLIGAAVPIVANWRWRSASADARSRLRSGGSSARGVFSHAELTGLPAPVLRYFRRVLYDGQRVIRAADLAQTGTFFVPMGGGRWCPFSATQRFVVQPAGFVWDARIHMMPLIPVHVRDGYRDGSGSMLASMGGAYALTNQAATPELDAGALQRYLAEAVWFPTALLPPAGVRWDAVDEHSAKATLTDAHTTVSLTFRFDQTGDVELISGDRFREDHGRFVATPWTVRCIEYDTHNGVRIPVECEVAWQLPEGPLPYWRGRLGDVQYEFAD